jgi:putative NIF3 family GTP cyclohydrolase 1 type 2
MTFGELAEFVKHSLPDNGAMKAAGDKETRVRTAAVCGGAGASMSADAFDAGVDVYITAEVKHHEGIDTVGRGRCIIDAGHSGTESLFITAMADYLDANFDKEIEIIKSTSHADPFWGF